MAEVVVAQTQIEGQFAIHLPIVLDVGLKIPLMIGRILQTADGHTVNDRGRLRILPHASQKHVRERIPSGYGIAPRESHKALIIQTVRSVGVKILSVDSE